MEEAFTEMVQTQQGIQILVESPSLFLFPLLEQVVRVAVLEQVVRVGLVVEVV